MALGSMGGQGGGQGGSGSQISSGTITAIIAADTVHNIAAFSLDGGTTYSWSAATKPTTRPASLGSAALVSGDRWYSTAAGDRCWWFWDGAHWLSDVVFSTFITNQLDVTNTSAPIAGVQQNQAPEGLLEYDLYIVDVFGTTEPVGTAQTVGNHITITAAYYNGAGWVTIGTGFDSTGDTDSIINPHVAHVNTWIDFSAATVLCYSPYSTITGTPGRVIQSGEFSYRRAHR